VQFKLDSAEIVKGPASEGVLEAVAAVLAAHPEITKVSVEGHTDNVGKVAHNKELSANRAAAVVKWLVQHGIDKSRLTSKGWGIEKPIVSNSTEEGRTKNRRVEFHIEERKP
jgi:outer membrane protein OmpA-like peptidoglycan-associated protein